MSDFKFELNSNGVRELLKCPGIQEELKKRGQEVANRADGAWETKSGVGSVRANVKVVTNDKDTFYKNLKTNTLIKALG